MFYRLRDIDWKIPVASLVGIGVLVFGIYIGAKSINNNPEVQSVNYTNREQHKDAFYLNSNCEIVINTIDELSSELIDSKTVRAPEEVFNKTEDEIISYIQKTYPNTEIQSITQGEILLTEKLEGSHIDMTRKNKYSIEIENGFIGVYKYDINGKRALESKTDQKIDQLPQMLQEEIQKGIVADSIEEIDAILDSILS